MKKFLAIFLVLALLFSFAACNKGDDTDDNTTTEVQVGEQSTNGEEDTTKKKPRPETTTAAPFVNPNLTEPAELFKVVGVDNYTATINPPKTTPSSGVTLIVKRYDRKVSDANSIPEKITLGSFEVTLNETVIKELLSNGWTVASKQDANTAVEAGKDAGLLLKDSKNDVVIIGVRNKSDVTMPISECVVTRVSVNKTVEQRSWTDYTIGGVVNTGTATYADCVNLFGNPKSINVGEYYKGNDYNYCKPTLIFEKIVNNETWVITVGFEDSNGKTIINSCTVEVK